MNEFVFLKKKKIKEKRNFNGYSFDKIILKIIYIK